MKNVLVTGASKGIGKAIAKILFEKYCVIAIDIEKPSHDYCHYFYQCDLSDRESLLAVISKIKNDFDTLYGLINNAGVFIHMPLCEQSIEDWEKIIAINLTAPYLLSKEFSPLLSKSKGHIVNIASTRAINSEVGTEPYSASKGGLQSLTHALAMSLAGQVSVNSISPGWINTDVTYTPTQSDNAWHPSGRVGEPKDVAEFVAFLLEKEEGFITASDFVVDGGVSKKMVYM